MLTPHWMVYSLLNASILSLNLLFLSAPPLFKVRHQELTQFLTPSDCTPFQDIYSSLVEAWPFKGRTTSADKEKIVFIMDWWTAYYQYGLKRQASITPGNILVELKTRAGARAAADKVAKEGTVPMKRSKRQHAHAASC